MATFTQQMADYARGEKLKALRAQRHLSQEGAAHEIGVSTKTVREWEKGGPIKWVNAKKVGAFYGIDPETIVSREEGEPQLEAAASSNGQISEQLEDVLARLAGLDRRMDDLAQQLAELAEGQRDLATTNRRFDTRLRKLAQTVEALPTPQRHRGAG